jgi:hypothetical protein
MSINSFKLEVFEKEILQWNEITPWHGKSGMDNRLCWKIAR